MLNVITWRWGSHFGREYVERLAGMFRRHLRTPHQIVVVTDDPQPFGGGIVTVPMPTDYASTPRCRRRMQQYAADFLPGLGPRRLSIDLDMVLVDDVTPLFERTEPIVMWKVEHADVYSGSLVLFDAGALDGAWQAYREDPNGFPARAWPRGVGSDQAMLNLWLKGRPPIAEWSKADGIVTYYGKGYERLEHLGVGPNRPQLPAGARIVVLGGDDKGVMDAGAFDWIREHWIGERVTA